MENPGNLQEGFNQNIYFIGEKDFGTWENERIKKRTQEFIDFYLDKFKEETFLELKIEIRAMNEEGNQKEYEIKILFVTDKENFHSEKTGWNAYNVFNDALKAIETQVFDK